MKFEEGPGMGGGLGGPPREKFGIYCSLVATGCEI